MNKTQLIDRIAEIADISKKDASSALGGVIDAITEALKAGDKITLVGFGTFSVGERAARKARNLKTGAEINVPAKKVVKFKAGKELSQTV